MNSPAWLPATVRTIRWQPAALAFLTASVLLGWNARLAIAPGDALAIQRVVTFVLVLGCCTALDDPAAPTLSACPTPLRTRRLRSAGLVVAVAAVPWTGAALLVGWRAGTLDLAPELFVEAATELAIAAATATLAQRRGLHEPGMLVAAITTAALLAIVQLRGSAALFTSLEDQRWAASHKTWLAILLAALIISALATRDPGAPSWRTLLPIRR